ncbi:MAG: zinc ribbon domain-containing protein [Lachnospiraceae bacterium]|nr:zinc ribbon domain-containing protein [Lachnospiraceae bacterium]
MALLDDLGKKINDVGQKTKDIADIAKYNSMITEEERKVRELYIQIGRKYTAEYAQSATGEMADWIRGVKEGEAKISEYTEIVRSLKGIAVCPNCGAEVDADKPFCSSCGTKMPEIEKPDGKIPCPRCGARVPKDSRFCTACGQPLS